MIRVGFDIVKKWYENQSSVQENKQNKLFWDIKIQLESQSDKKKDLTVYKKRILIICAYGAFKKRKKWKEYNEKSGRNVIS